MLVERKVAAVPCCSQNLDDMVQNKAFDFPGRRSMMVLRIWITAAEVDCFEAEDGRCHCEMVVRSDDASQGVE